MKVDNEVEQQQQEEEIVTHTELKAWYAFLFASEPFVVVALAIMYPLLLQSLAANSGYERGVRLVYVD